MARSTSVSLHDAPAIPGLTFRHFAQTSDYTGLAAVHEGARAWDRVDERSAREGIPTAADLRATFPEAQIVGNPDLLLAEINQQIIGYSHTLWRWTEVTGTRVYLHLGYLLPGWRQQGIGQALLHWSQRRICEIASGEQADGVQTFATNVSSTEQEADRLIRQAGYSAVRRLSDMALEPIPDQVPTALPPGVQLRPVKPTHYRAIYQAWKDAFQPLWTSTPASGEDYQAFLGDNVQIGDFDPNFWQVAWSGDEVVGFVITRIRAGIGTVPEVAVRRAWQRRGIARWLMLSALQLLRQRDITHVRLFTDADDGQGARSLYAALGFQEVKQHIFYRKPFSQGI